MHVAPAPNRDYFIYMVHKDDTADVLSTYITERGVKIRLLETKSHDDALYNSFRLVVSADYEDKLLEPEFWPSGVHVRRWFGNDRGNKIRMRQGSIVVNEEETIPKSM